MSSECTPTKLSATQGRSSSALGHSNASTREALITAAVHAAAERRSAAQQQQQQDQQQHLHAMSRQATAPGTPYVLCRALPPASRPETPSDMRASTPLQMRRIPEGYTLVPASMAQHFIQGSAHPQQRNHQYAMANVSSVHDLYAMSRGANPAYCIVPFAHSSGQPSRHQQTQQLNQQKQQQQQRNSIMASSSSKLEAQSAPRARLVVDPTTGEVFKIYVNSSASVRAVQTRHASSQPKPQTPTMQDANETTARTSPANVDADIKIVSEHEQMNSNSTTVALASNDIQETIEIEIEGEVKPITDESAAAALIDLKNSEGPRPSETKASISTSNSCSTIVVGDKIENTNNEPSKTSTDKNDVNTADQSCDDAPEKMHEIEEEHESEEKNQVCGNRPIDSTSEDVPRKRARTTQWAQGGSGRSDDAPVHEQQRAYIVAAKHPNGTGAHPSQEQYQIITPFIRYPTVQGLVGRTPTLSRSLLVPARQSRASGVPSEVMTPTFVAIGPNGTRLIAHPSSQGHSHTFENISGTGGRIGRVSRSPVHSNATAIHYSPLQVAQLRSVSNLARFSRTGLVRSTTDASKSPKHSRTQSGSEKDEQDTKMADASMITSSTATFSDKYTVGGPKVTGSAHHEKNDDKSVADGAERHATNTKPSNNVRRERETSRIDTHLFETDTHWIVLAYAPDFEIRHLCVLLVQNPGKGATRAAATERIEAAAPEQTRKSTKETEKNSSEKKSTETSQKPIEKRSGRRSAKDDSSNDNDRAATEALARSVGSLSRDTVYDAIMIEAYRGRTVMDSEGSVVKRSCSARSVVALGGSAVLGSLTTASVPNKEGWIEIRVAKRQPTRK